MKNLIILIVLASFLYSCAKDNVSNGSPDNKGFLITARTDCDVTETTRLRANEDFTIIVTHCYVNDVLMDVEYEIDDSEPGDKIAMLNLAGTNSTVKVNLLNNTISSLSSTPIVSGSYNNVGGGTEYSCECNNSQSSANDCWKSTYAGKLKYCEGNFCDACSVVLGFQTSGGRIVTEAQSIVILPNNF